MQIGALIVLFMFALFAKSIGNLFEARMLSSTATLAANVHFQGKVSQVLEDQGVMVVVGSAHLSNISGFPNAGLLASNSWSASAILPFKRNPSGAAVLSGQGRMHIRATPTGVTPIVLNADVSNIIGVLIGLEVYDPFDFDGDVVALSDTIIDDLNTEVALTDPWGPGQFGMTVTLLEQTNIAIDTQWPMTNTPNSGIPTSVITPQATFAGPGF